jgi:hypothetical protein
MGPGDVLAAIPDGVPLLLGVAHAVGVGVPRLYLLDLLGADGVVEPLFKRKILIDHGHSPPYLYRPIL